MQTDQTVCYGEARVRLLSTTDPIIDDSINAPNIRKPLSGNLTMRVHAVQDVDHATTGRFSRGPETYVSLKVEDAFKGKTRNTRTDRWDGDGFDVYVDKANEVELTVYDKAGDRPTPIGLLWVRISDIVEEMRRKKIESDFNSAGWVSADKMRDSGGSTRTDGHFSLGGIPQPGNNRGPGGLQPGQGGPAGPGGQGGAAGGNVEIDAWFALEPSGRIHVTMGFSMFRCHKLQSDWMLTKTSETNEGPTTIRCWPQSSRCRASKERRGSREARPQIYHTTVLQHHALRSLR